MKIWENSELVFSEETSVKSEYLYALIDQQECKTNVIILAKSKKY